MDCFSNIFTPDKGNLANKISSLDDIDNEGTVSTYRRLKYSSSSLRNSDISTILEIMIATDTINSIGHMDSKEVEKLGGRYNITVMGY